jgi:hypothetical protein
MKPLALALASLLFLAAAPAAPAHERPGDPDGRVTREEIRQRKAEIREMEEELRLRERRQRRQARRPRAWLGGSWGVGAGSLDTCPDTSASSACSRDGAFGLWGGNVTVTGETQVLRLRGARPVNRGGNSRTPYEQAALLGSRLGHGDWYLALGYGRILHPDDAYDGDLKGLAYDVFYAPSSRSGSGLELSFRGLVAEDGAYGSVNLGLRFGRLR